MTTEAAASMAVWSSVKPVNRNNQIMCLQLRHTQIQAQEQLTPLHCFHQTLSQLFG